MAKPLEGTVEWFEVARHRTIDHMRALLAMRGAHQSVVTLLQNWDALDVDAARALHESAVISYARPFTPAATTAGKIAYAISAVRKADGFDRQLHDHLLDVRNRMIAHADYGVFPSAMTVQTTGDEALPVALVILVKNLAGIQERELAERYQRHFRACMEAIESALNSEVAELVAHARKHPTAFEASHNVPMSIEEWKAGPDFADLPTPTGPASRVPEPLFPKELSGYRYLTLQHQVPLIDAGKYTVHFDGKPVEIELDVTYPGEIPPVI